MGPLTLPIEHADDHRPPTDEESDPKFSAENSHYWIIAFIAGLVALWFMRKTSGYLQGNAIAISAYNFMAIALMAALGFILLKLLVSKFPVPGLTALVHAI
jgi:hypothetical protein